MNSKIKGIISLFFLIFSIFSISPKVLAEESGGFSVSPLDPETGEVQSSYYDLTVVPDQKLKLQVEIYNSSDKNMKIQVETNTASTNNNGITSYLKTEQQDSSLKVAFDKIAKAETEQVNVPAKGTAVANINIEIPKDAFKGEILGGLRFTEIKTEEEKKQQKNAVENNIAYTIGVLLHESDEEVAPEMALNKVFTEQRNSRNYISANLQNKAPRIIRELTVKAQVYQKGTDKLSYEASNDAMRMAPNSNFNFGISLENKKFIPGEYTMKISGTADGEPFDFSQDFTITAKEAKEYNKNSVFITDEPKTNYLLYVLGILLLIFIVVFLWFIKNKKKVSKK
ncbi:MULTISPECIES: DUF916 and DUF3324 domain-containing protein [unclassified Enterococcus]|uniref:DUF916 and DUF3324 domain-containing protein n=1 Tax=unclassified Enterococcus TaxID=2608891 RepID=UPI0013EA7B53|nr:MULTISPECIES: DUF916 and DUF3324 domain-containing protein [unclassified Enterococcus]